MKIGILGGGQLAKMLALAGYPLGINVICIDPALGCSATQVAKVVPSSFHDLEEISKHFHDVDCVTYETENLPYDAVLPIANRYQLVPGIQALKITQDRLYEKDFLNELHIPTAQYRQIDHWNDLQEAIAPLHFPLVLKTRRNGYDGKGQFVIANEADAKNAWEQAGSQLLIAEAFVPFQCEVSLVFARGHSSDVVFYPLTLNHHQQGILRYSQAPYLNTNLQTTAQNYAVAIAEKLNYIGVMAIEFFCINDSELIVNEIAPRVHNSGHWTIEGAVTSQFENHMRAISGLPLGCTDTHGYSTMINCIGQEPNNLQAILSIPGLHYHTYGKSPRAHRKLGHITICAEDQQQLANRVTAFNHLVVI